MRKLDAAIKACARYFIQQWPFGYLWEENDGKGGYVRLTKQLEFS